MGLKIKKGQKQNQETNTRKQQLNPTIPSKLLSLKRSFMGRNEQTTKACSSFCFILLLVKTKIRT